MFVGTYVLSFLLNCILSVEEEGYYKWSPKSITRDDLLCPNRCKRYNEAGNSAVTEDKCCICVAKAFWELNSRTSLLIDLPIEYLNRRGHSSILDIDENSGNFHEVTHIRGIMTKLPENLCNITNLVTVDFSENEIQSIDGISCGAQLNKIILKGNLIRFIGNETFAGMLYLRVIDLSDNLIERMEPFSLSQPELGLTHIYLQNNEMQTIDVTNFIFSEEFCELDASNNKIESLVNEAGVVMNDSIVYGGGMVNIRNNAFKSFPDITKLGLKNLTEVARLFNYGFDFRGAEFECNANMVHFLQLAEPVIHTIYRDYFDVKCDSPARLKGEVIVQLVKDKRLDELTSELSANDGCPLHCSCIYRPVIKHSPGLKLTEVNCTSPLLFYMPNQMPEEGYLSIDFSHTSIKTFSTNDYNHRIRHIVFRNSKLTEISNGTIAQFEAKDVTIDLSDTPQMSAITKEYRLLNACKIFFGVKNIKCSCDDTWIQVWLDLHDCTSGNVLTCETNKGSVPLRRLSEFLLCEEINLLYRILSISFASFLLVLTFCISFIYHYRYELMIQFKRYTKDNEIDWNKFKYDVYISMHDSDPHLRDWTSNVLLPDLQVAGYNIYCPMINAELGKPLDEEVIEKLSVSRNFLIFLSQDYVGNLDDDGYENMKTRLEWKFAWDFFKKNMDRRMIILNFDQSRRCEVTSPEIKAFLRLRKTLDFSNRNHMLLQEIKELLGLPKRQYRGLGSTKPTFKKDSILLQKNEIVHLQI